MNILVTGGCGFIGSHLVERLVREGHKVTVIDNLHSGDTSNLSVKHRFHKLDVKSSKCEEIFKDNRFDAVVHLAAYVDADMSMKIPYDYSENNILGLVNILELSRKFDVKKFIFTSSAAVYGENTDLPLDEKSECLPTSTYGTNKLNAERYCDLYSRKYGMETTALRLSNVYGARQSLTGEGGVVVNFMNNILNDKKNIIFGDGNQTRDFIYVGDVVDAIYKALHFSSEKVLNISTNTEVSVNSLLGLIEKVSGKKTEVEYRDEKVGDIKRSVLSNENAKKTLEWSPIVGIEDGLKKTFDWYTEQGIPHIDIEDKKLDVEENIIKEEKEKGLFKRILPYIENILVFILVVVLTQYTNEQGIETDIDFKLIYIIVIGIVYGLKQSSIAIVLASAFYIWEIHGSNFDLISIMYNVNTLIHISLYIFVGTILGYSIESKKIEIENKEEEIIEQKEKFTFLYNLYNEGREIREELSNQIINSEDSFGKIYSALKSLGSLEKNEIYGKTVSSIEDLMKADRVALFGLSKNGEYLRLISKSDKEGFITSKSVKLSDYPKISKAINNKEIFINRELEEGLPLMLAPVVIEDKVASIIAIYSMEFEKVSLYKENLLRIISELLKNSLVNALKYEEAVFEERHVENSIVLKKEFFDEKIKERFETYKNKGINFVVLKINSYNWREYNYDHIIANAIRELDYIGIDDDENLLVLLSNTSKAEADQVIERLDALSITTDYCKEGEDYENTLDFYNTSNN